MKSNVEHGWTWDTVTPGQHDVDNQHDVNIEMHVDMMSTWCPMLNMMFVLQHEVLNNNRQRTGLIVGSNNIQVSQFDIWLKDVATCPVPAIRMGSTVKSEGTLVYY